MELKLAEHFYFHRGVEGPKEPQNVFLGGMSYNGPGALVPVEGMMNYDKYTNLLKSRVVPLLSKSFYDVNGSFGKFQLHAFLKNA